MLNIRLKYNLVRTISIVLTVSSRFVLRCEASGCIVNMTVMMTHVISRLMVSLKLMLLPKWAMKVRKA